MRMFLLCALLLGGCVERTITINSSPPGALVYLNDEEVGRTPVTRDFTWYGDYSVTLRAEGCETLKTHQEVVAPWYQFVPIDLISEIWPSKFKDRHEFTYDLEPLPVVDDKTMVHRAVEMKGELQGSRLPATRPTTRPATTRRAKR